MKQIGRYQVVRRLGKGGMGAVYKGIAPVIEKVVAIKLLAPLEVMEDILGLDKLHEIFMFEAKTMASFHHPNLVTAYDYDFDQEGRPYFVMEYICKNLGEMIGEDFQVEKDSRVIRPQKVFHYGSQILQALAFLHHKNIVHRDVKPQNILVTDEDTIKICDFGMALVEGTAFCGPANMQIGSPYYTPPEQRKDPLAVDGRADLYSAAVLLYRMLTGKLPGMQSLSLSQVNPLYDEEWDNFFLKALSWNPDKRFNDADEMREAFELLNLHSGSDTYGGLSTDCPVSRSAGLRNEPINVCKSRAAGAFDVSPLYRPTNLQKRCIEVRGELFVDKAAGIAWPSRPSRFPLSQHDAFQWIEQLNGERAQGIDNWRLPTVNELLSLLVPDEQGYWFDFGLSDAFWLWSCDLHGNHEGWYVNLDMGYTGVQDINCLNYVLPVCTMGP